MSLLNRCHYSQFYIYGLSVCALRPIHMLKLEFPMGLYVEVRLWEVISHEATAFIYGIGVLIRRDTGEIIFLSVM